MHSIACQDADCSLALQCFKQDHFLLASGGFSFGGGGQTVAATATGTGFALGAAATSTAPTGGLSLGEQIGTHQLPTKLRPQIVVDSNCLEPQEVRDQEGRS